MDHWNGKKELKTYSIKVIRKLQTSVACRKISLQNVVLTDAEDGDDNIVGRDLLAQFGLAVVQHQTLVIFFKISLQKPSNKRCNHRTISNLQVWFLVLASKLQH